MANATARYGSKLIIGTSSSGKSVTKILASEVSPVRSAAEMTTTASCTHRRLVKAPVRAVSTTNPPYSMSSSARARTGGGIVSPSALAVFKLTTSSNFVGCWTGRSAGLAPLRIFPA
jgi:hypothetical protein